MSCKGDERTRSESRDSSSHAQENLPDGEFGPLRSDAPFSDGEDFVSLNLSGVLRRHGSPGSDAGSPASEELPGLGFALSERLDLLKARIDTLLKETASRRRLHHTVQKAFQAELREQYRIPVHTRRLQLRRHGSRA